MQQSPFSDFKKCTQGLAGCLKGRSRNFNFFDLEITALHLTLERLKANSVCKSSLPVTNPQKHIGHTAT